MLAYGDTKALDDNIEDMAEQLQTMEEEQREYLEELEERLLEPEGEASRLKEIVETYEEQKPQKFVRVVTPGDAAQSVPAEQVPDEETEDPGPGWALSEEYQKWKQEHDLFEGRYRILAHQNDTARLQQEQRTQLYELDHAYLEDQLKLLKNRREQYVLKTDMAGEVVALKLRDAETGSNSVIDAMVDRYLDPVPQGLLQNGESVSMGTAVAAVANPGRTVIKCGYITKSSLAVAQEVYAYIDGKRYEARLTETDSADGSIFELTDAEGEFTVGMKAFVVILAWSRENVLTVPKDSVHGERGNYYVNRKENGETLMTPVTIGQSDGVYTEILSGLQEGDEVEIASSIAAGDRRSTLQKGSPEMQSTFRSELFFPNTYWARNTISEGTVYFVEYQVGQYQQVKEGDVIASIRVEIDDIQLKEYETRLGRLNERLQDLIEQGEESQKSAIKEQRKSIEELEERIAQLRGAADAVEIRAPRSGVILSLFSYEEGDLIPEDAQLAEIAEVDDIYIIVREAGETALYGEEDIRVQYNVRGVGGRETFGRVVSMSADGLSGSLASEYALVKVPFEAAMEMLQAVMESDIFNSSVNVTLTTRLVGEVILVPSAAVKNIAGQTYVMVEEADGSITARSFLSGGSGNGYYWAIDGLEEGMKICSM